MCPQYEFKLILGTLECKHFPNKVVGITWEYNSHQKKDFSLPNNPLWTQYLQSYAIKFYTIKKSMQHLFLPCLLRDFRLYTKEEEKIHQISLTKFQHEIKTLVNLSDSVARLVSQSQKKILNWEVVWSITLRGIKKWNVSDNKKKYHMR